MSSQELKQLGLKVTLPRMKILHMLQARAHQHLTAEDVYKTLLESGEEIGLATVYRVLTQFEIGRIGQASLFRGRTVVLRTG